SAGTPDGLRQRATPTPGQAVAPPRMRMPTTLRIRGGATACPGVSEKDDPLNTQPLGKSDLLSTRLAYGCWRICGTWDPAQVTPQGREAGTPAVVAALE